MIVYVTISKYQWLIENAIKKTNETNICQLRDDDDNELTWSIFVDKSHRKWKEHRFIETTNIYEIICLINKESSRLSRNILLVIIELFKYLIAHFLAVCILLSHTLLESFHNLNDIFISKKKAVINSMHLLDKIDVLIWQKRALINVVLTTQCKYSFVFIQDILEKRQEMILYNKMHHALLFSFSSWFSFHFLHFVFIRWFWAFHSSDLFSLNWIHWFIKFKFCVLDLSISL